MRVLLDDDGRLPPGSVVDAAALRTLYAAPPGRWLRANFVATVDGAATGADGRSGSINTPADHVVFALLRDLCDAVLVGAGTARTEEYTRVSATPTRPLPPALVVVSGRAHVPDGLAEPRTGRGAGLLVTCEAAGLDALRRAREVLGADAVLVCGEGAVDIALTLDELANRGLRHVLCEGGPTLLAAVLQAGLLDELALTTSPLMTGGNAPRISQGESLDLHLSPRLLLEEDGSLFALWRPLTPTGRSPHPVDPVPTTLPDPTPTVT